ncbi:MAG: YCF48-related protein [Bacteroidota bacterium]|nr:YCF48-related protein [Bacteroidota bacterium]
MSTFVYRLTFLLIICHYSFSLPQNNWSWQNPVPQGNPLNSVYFVDANTGWAAGNSGTIIRTTNGGNTWELQSSGVKHNLNSVYFINGNTGWIAGDTNIILKTNNGGVTWFKQLDTTLLCHINSLSIPDGNNGWAVGRTIYYNIGAIFHTRNGGAVWKLENLMNEYETPLFGTYFLSGSIGWGVGGSGVIYKFKYLNDTLKSIKQVKATYANLTSVCFLNSSLGWASTDFGTIIKTVTGTADSAIWIEKQTCTDKPLKSIFFIDANNGWAVGGNYMLNTGVIIKTTDGGESWTNVTPDTNHYYTSVGFKGGTGIAVSQSSYICRSTNSGNSWSEVSGGIRNLGLSSIYFCNEHIGWASGNSGLIVKTTNGGETWTKIPTNVSSDLHAIAFPSMTTGWAVGNKDFHNTGRMILKTSNGGNSWVEQSIGGASKWLYSVCFADTITGWASGNEGLILRTTHGESWTTQPTPTNSALYSLCFPTRYTGYSVGNNGVIIKTTDGGTSWFSQTHPSANSLGSVYFLDSLNGWAAGDIVLKTTNGGSDWVKLNNNYFCYINSLCFINSLTGWAVGQNNFGNVGIILYTSDGGNSWDEKLLTNYTYCTAALQNIKFYGNNLGWAVGGNGAILHTTNGGVVFADGDKNVHVKEYSLSQNYPNPFNPSTTINYTLAKPGVVTLKLFDMLGKEEAVLVNERKEAGNYGYEFKNSGLSSGVYFYTLRINDYVQTKKMVFLK